MQYRIRDMTTGLYMNSLSIEGSKKEPTWHETGSVLKSIDSLIEQLTLLVEGGHQISSLWEVEEVSLDIIERSPAVIYAPKVKATTRK